MTNKNFISKRFSVIAFLAVLFLISFVVAESPDAFPESVLGNSSSVNHGDSFEIKFNIKNNHSTSSITDLKIKLPNLAIGKWTSAKLGSTSYPINNNEVVIPASDLSILNKTSSPQFVLAFKVDSFVVPGKTSNSISFSGNLVPAGTPASIDSLPVSITVLSSSTLSLAVIRDFALSQNNATLNVTNTGNVLLNNIEVSTSGDFSVTLPAETFSLNPGASKTLQAIADLSNLKFGSNAVTITAKSGDIKDSKTSTLSNSFCKNGSISGKLEIRNIDLSVEVGDDENDWKPLNRIKIEVEVENNHDDTVDDVIVELGLFDQTGENMVSDLDFSNKDEEKYDIGNLGEDDSEVATFEFTVPGDFETGNYKLAVKVYSDNDGESKVCDDRSSDLDNTFYETISVDTEDDEGRYIGFDNVKITPSQVSCRDPVTLTMDVFNVGEEDQDQVKVNLINKDLKLDLSNEIRRDLDMGEKQKIVFTFNVPEGLTDKTYDVELNSEYDYRNGVYRMSSDDKFIVPIKLVGCVPENKTIVPQKIASISATLESEAIAGEQMVVKATVRNVANTSYSFVIGPKNFESWATLVDSSNRLVTLNAGDSKDATFTFSLNKDVEGEKSFVIETVANGKSETREVFVTIAKKTSGLGDFFKDNTLVWVIGIINVLLIIVIIIVAMRIARR